MSSKYKALIIYSSITGNTEKIANAFAETFREYNIEPTLKKLEGNYLGEQMDPPDTGAYDFLVLGAPVIAGIPYHDFYINFGAQDDYGRRSFGGIPVVLAAPAAPAAPAVPVVPVDPVARAAPAADRTVPLPAVWACPA